MCRTTTQRTAPTAISGGHTWESIEVGFGHSCGITTSGVGYCWGRNNYGRLGDGTTTDRSIPTAISGDHIWDSMKIYYNVCGITTSGEGYCWGRNRWGNLGDGTTAQRTTPVKVSDPW